MTDQNQKKRFLSRLSHRIAAVALLCAAMMAVGATWAYFSDTNTWNNPMGTGSHGLSLNENFNPGSTFLPGETVEKQPYFVNQGDSDLYIRLKNPKQCMWWAEKADLDTPLEDYDTKYVEIAWTESWENDWTEIDGYYYYNKILRVKGAESEEENSWRTPWIMESLKLLPELDVTNDRHREHDYSDKVFVMNLDAVGLPTDTPASEIQDKWGVTVSEKDGVLTWK